MINISYLLFGVGREQLGLINVSSSVATSFNYSVSISGSKIEQSAFRLISPSISQKSAANIGSYIW